MKTTFVLALLILSGIVAFAQARKTENLIIITFDGMRWQEVFGGVDSVLMDDSVFTRDRKGIKEKFWAHTPEERRKKLFPFLWTTIAEGGQLYGNRRYQNAVNNANPYRFSYPGYNEIFTGYPDTSVNSNNKIPNKNVNVLEFLNKQERYKGKVSAFTSWDVFDAILNEGRSGFLVSSGFDKLNSQQTQSPALQLLNEMQELSPQPLGAGVRPDFITYFLAREYLKKYRPRVLYIGFDETDDYAHQGKYDPYLETALFTDKWIADLWSYIQTQPEYKNKTTILITTDHGRGDQTKANWKHHGQKIPDASEIWFAAMGPDTKPGGEVKVPMQLYQQQIAATIAAFLGLKFTADHPIAEPISSVLYK